MIGRLYLTFLFNLIIFSVFSQIPSGYYDNVAGKSGEELKTELYHIIKGHTEFSYTSTSTDTWDILKEADADPEDPTYVIGIYSGFKMIAAEEYNSGQGWNREHVWAQSRGELGTNRGPGTDTHNLRAADISTNSARSNRNFDYADFEYIDQSGVYSGPTNSKTSSERYVWEPRDEVKGDIARTIFYMATRYEGENGEPDLEIVEALLSQSGKEPIHAKLTTLLEWHEMDPVDDWERNRNDVIYSYQINRNPYIDHPEYVKLIWGNDLCENLYPTILFNQNSFSFAAIEIGQTSSTFSYTIQASDILDSIAILPPTDFEISLSQNFNDFSTSSNQLIIRSNEQGTIQTEIFVRFKGTNNNLGDRQSTLSHITNCEVQETITFQTMVTAPDSNLCEEVNLNYQFSVDFLNFDIKSNEGASNKISYSIIATDVQSAIKIVPPKDFQITEDIEFKSALISPDTLFIQPINNQIQVDLFLRYFPRDNQPKNLIDSIYHKTSCSEDFYLRLETFVADINILSLGKQNLESKIFIYPNPFSKHQSVNANIPKGSSVKLYNQTGKILFYSNSKLQLTQKLESLNEGVYYLLVEKDQKTYAQKILIE